MVNLVRKKIETSNGAANYSYESTDLDDSVMVHSIAGTEFPKIAEGIMAGTDAPVAESVEDLNDTWATVIFVDIAGGKRCVFAFRKLQESWKLKKLNGLINLVFHGGKLTEVETDAVLRLDQNIDFLAYQDSLLILNKARFEQGLNFRHGMEAKRDQVFGELGALKIFTNQEPLVKRCGSNMHYLRKIVDIKKSGYYNDKNFMTSLQKVAKEENWPLEFVDGQIVMNDDNIDLILTLLGNNRVKSFVNQERFDVEGVKKPF